MFQLFNAEDLKALTEQQLEELVSAIRNANRTSPDPFLRIAAASDLSTHWEDTRRDLLQTPPAIPVINITELTHALRDRARQVFEQLLGRFPDQPQGPLDPKQPDILSQLIDQNALSDLAAPARSKEKRIFEIAISCELSYFNSYSFLRPIKADAYQRFSADISPIAAPGQVPKGPDSPYSPYRRDHPLYQ
jgi:hypothetical protein